MQVHLQTRIGIMLPGPVQSARRDRPERCVSLRAKASLRSAGLGPRREPPPLRDGDRRGARSRSLCFPPRQSLAALGRLGATAGTASPCGTATAAAFPVGMALAPLGGAGRRAERVGKRLVVQDGQPGDGPGQCHVEPL